jgi:hypothetical protein
LAAALGGGPHASGTEGHGHSRGSVGKARAWLAAYADPEAQLTRAANERAKAAAFASYIDSQQKAVAAAEAAQAAAQAATGAAGAAAAEAGAEAGAAAAVPSISSDAHLEMRAAALATFWEAARGPSAAAAAAQLRVMCIGAGAETSETLLPV